ncbi:hypothetical protein KKA93_03015 [Patescibacteria group bacterium]|nr:hypothetical protein [Patescibacteria group bacterium]MBU1663656.1 hypothetical protein [Patescibacteria group bacterium]MBU1933987.1 hypothetical protein [Patescibacteria group bacterium]MBU2007684.1 hypothetical protein [Patescibacteria group bacterium]MBU2233506.1 hypothetical protein [Patescibacteria group bacterium]
MKYEEPQKIKTPAEEIADLDSLETENQGVLSYEQNKRREQLRDMVEGKSQKETHKSADEQELAELDALEIENQGVLPETLNRRREQLRDKIEGKLNQEEAQTLEEKELE